jgi:hypothetical protein
MMSSLRARKLFKRREVEEGDLAGASIVPMATVLVSSKGINEKAKNLTLIFSILSVNTVYGDG